MRPRASGSGPRPGRTASSWSSGTSSTRRSCPPATLQMASDLYDDSIAHLDRQLGALLDELQRRGVLDDTLVVVTSDHGEHLGDHGLFFHGCSLYRQLVEVPLVIVDPEGVPAGRAVAEPVSLRDVPATVLDLLGLGEWRRVPRAIARPIVGPGRRAGPPRIRSIIHGGGQVRLSHEPGPRAGRQGADAGDGRRRDALHPLGRWE